VRPGVVVLLVALVLVAGLIAVGSGWRGLVVYGFFVGFAAVLTFGAGAAGELLTGWSRGRFGRDDRH
jgi:hypothetical protein